MSTDKWRKATCPCSSDYGPDDTDFKRKKASNCWDKVEDSGNKRSPADNNSTGGIGEQKTFNYFFKNP